MANVERKTVDKTCLKGIPIVWVLGGPGSGKGTQCEMIHLKYPFTHLSSGDLLRSEVLSGSNRGSQLYKLMSNGESVPNTIVDDLLAEAMVAKVDKGTKGFLIDGFPMDVAQAEAFEADIAPPNCVLYFEGPDDLFRERLTTRNNFDDNKDSIEKRIANFHAKTEPVLEKYADKVKKVNVERPKEEIFEDVKKIMDAVN